MPYQGSISDNTYPNGIQPIRPDLSGFGATHNPPIREVIEQHHCVTQRRSRPLMGPALRQREFRLDTTMDASQDSGSRWGHGLLSGEEVAAVAIALQVVTS